MGQTIARPSKAPEHYKIILFGDSICQGIIYDPEKQKYRVSKQTFGYIIQSYFKGKVLNKGRLGNHILKAMDRLLYDVLDKEPDMVLIEFGNNEGLYDWQAIAKNPEADYKPRTELPVFKTELLELIEILRKKKIAPLLLCLPPVYSEYYFHSITKGSELKKAKFLKWLGHISWLGRHQGRYDAMVREVAQQSATPLIDIRKPFMEKPDLSPYYCKDGIHPNIEGHKMIAKTILNYFKANYSDLMKE